MARGDILASVIAHFEAHGSQTRGQVALALDLTYSQTVSVWKLLRKAPRRLYIIRWTRTDPLSNEHRSRAVWRLGAHKDAVRPAPEDRKEAFKRYSKSRRAPRGGLGRATGKVTSVFDLGLTRDQREAKTRTMKATPCS